MRIISTIVVAALVGVLAGGAVAYVEVRSDPDALDKLADELAASAKPGDKETPRIAVDQPHYDFGTMQRGTSKSHEFVIRNVGNAPLKIRNGGTTCKCTLSKVADESIRTGRIDQGEARMVGEVRQRAFPPDGHDSYQRPDTVAN